MTVGGARILSRTLAFATLCLLAADLFLTAGSVATAADDVPFIIAVSIGITGFAVVGAILAARVPADPIGWLFQGAALSLVVAVAGSDYAVRASTDLTGLPAVGVAGVLSQGPFPLAIAAILSSFLLFPDGHVLSRRWTPILWVLWISAGLATASTVLAIGVIETDADTRIANPAFILPEGIVSIAGPIAFFGLAAAGLLALISVIVRFRRSSGETRQQVRWLAWAASLILLSLIASFVTSAIADAGGSSIPGDVMFFLTVASFFLALPIATAVAILRFHLYDLDLVVKKTAIFAICVVLVMATGAVLAWILVSPVAWFVAGTGITSTAAAYFLLGLAVVPLWRLSRRIADRVVFGGRTSPYEVLAEFSERMSESYATEDVLPRMARIVREATGATAATVWLRVGREWRPESTAGDDAAVGPIAASRDEIPTLPGDLAAEVRHQGSLLGALSVTMPANDPMNPAKEKLVLDLAGQAGLVLRNVRLIEELRDSRRRLVAAQDEERRKLERNIHDGAQQQLVALAVRLKLAEQAVGKDPDREKDLLRQLGVQANDALEDLRDLARGIYPPLLADEGLAAALGAQARKAAVPTTVDADGIGRFPQEVEAAVYFACLEALQNTAKYAEATCATVSLRQDDGNLTFDVSDDGRGFDPEETGRGTGLQGIVDRLDAIGGDLTIRSAPDLGTAIVGRVPIAAGEAHA